MTKPKKYPTVQELEDKIDEYFDNCKPIALTDENGLPVFDKNGTPLTKEIPPTVSGLALFLGFEDRQSLYDYKKYENYSCTIKKAITRIENYAEQHLYEGKPTGAIFWLKNHGWIDKQENDTKLTLTQALVSFVGENESNAGESSDSAEVQTPIN